MPHVRANGELDEFSSEDSAVAEGEDQEYDPMDEVNAPVDSPAGKRARACYFCRHSAGRRRPGLVEK